MVCSVKDVKAGHGGFHEIKNAADLTVGMWVLGYM